MGNEDSYGIPDLGFMIIVLYVICAFGAISQVFLIVAFIKDPLKCFRNPATYLIVTLAVSDFLACLGTPFICWAKKWYCMALQFAMWSGIEVSLITIASISVDRFLMVVYPLKYRVLMKGNVVILLLTCIWLIGFVFPAKILLSITITNDMDQLLMNLQEVVCIIFASIMYGFTYFKLTKQSKNIALENVPNRQQQARVMRDKRFLRTIIVIACIAFACIVPTSVFYHYAVPQKLITGDAVVRILNTITTCIFYVNYAVNPLVYVLRLPNYRKTFYLLYCRKTTAR